HVPLHTAPHPRARGLLKPPGEPLTTTTASLRSHGLHAPERGPRGTGDTVHRPVELTRISVQHNRELLQRSHPSSPLDGSAEPAREFKQHVPLLSRSLSRPLPALTPLRHEVLHRPLLAAFLAALEHVGDPLRENPSEDVIPRLPQRSRHLLIRSPRRQLAGRHALQQLVHRVAEVAS